VALIRRGDIYLINYRPDGREGEAAQVHPGVIVTNNLANANTALLMSVPLTSNTERMYVTNVLLPLESTGLDHDSKAQVEALRATNVSRLIKRLGFVPDDLMVLINEKLRMNLGL
jgi:mRNA interferase MazF